MKTGYWYCEEHLPGEGLTLRVDELLFSQRSPFQKVDIFRNDSMGVVMTIDDLVMLTSADEFIYHEVITHPALFTHRKPEQVLIIGGGDGGTLRECLKHPVVKHVDMVEIDQVVMDVSRKYFDFAAPAMDDPRATVMADDGIAYMKKQKGKYDVIILDSSDPIGPATGLFSRSFFADCARALKPDGVVAGQIGKALALKGEKATSSEAVVMLQDFFPIVMPMFYCVPTYPHGLWCWALASKKYHPLDDFQERRAQATLPQMKNKLYNPGVHAGLFAVPEFFKMRLPQMSKRRGPAAKHLPQHSSRKAGK